MSEQMNEMDKGTIKIYCISDSSDQCWLLGRVRQPVRMGGVLIN